MSEQSLEQTNLNSEVLPVGNTEECPLSNSMEEFYQLEKTLTIVTLIISTLVFFPIWLLYSLNIALNSLLGAIVGVIYLRLLAKDVERLGQQSGRLGIKGLALFGGLIIVASQWQQLHILPVFFGFLTYKLAILLYMLKIVPISVKK